MTKIAQLADFDPAEHLKTEADMAAYLSAIIEENDPALLAAAMGDIAKSRGMTAIAQSAGIGREALYEALRPGAQPRFDTIARVCTALGLKSTVQPAG